MSSSIQSRQEEAFNKAPDKYKSRFNDNLKVNDAHLLSFVKGYDLEGYNFILLSDFGNFTPIFPEKSIYVFYILFFGKVGSKYEGGVYLGQIVLPSTYPDANPDFYMLNKSGRFIMSTNSDRPICLNISGFHNNTGNSSDSIVKFGYDLNTIFNGQNIGTGVNHVYPTPPDSEFKAIAATSVEELKTSTIKTYTGVEVKTVFEVFTKYINKRNKALSNNGGKPIPKPVKTKKSKFESDSKSVEPEKIPEVKTQPTSAPETGGKTIRVVKKNRGSSETMDL